MLAPVARKLRRAGSPDLAVGTSKTFRSLARLTGAAEPVLTAAELGQLLAFITRMSSHDLAELKGVSPGRAHQLVAGAIVARAAMRALRVPQVEICPWALREGVIFRRLDTLDGRDASGATTRRSGPAGVPDRPTSRVHRRPAEARAAAAPTVAANGSSIEHLPW